MTLLLSIPSVYSLPGTWEKQPMIPHFHLTPDQGFILFFGLVVLSLVAYGLYFTLGAGKKELRDTHCLLWLRGVNSPFSVPRPPEVDMLFAGVLLLHGLPWILYEYSEEPKKTTWRKV